MSLAIPSEPLAIPVAHGQLEARLHAPESPWAAALVCHPHPLLGGTMNNPVAYRLARGLYGAGLAVLRFNFRGVGASTGSWGEVTGEEQDAQAGLELLAARFPGLPLWVAGFSFGARVGLLVGARDGRVERLLGAGLALSAFDHSEFERCAKPKAFVQAEQDEYGGAAQVAAFVERLPEPKRLRVVAGTTHLFPGRLPELEREIDDAVAWLRGLR